MAWTSPRPGSTPRSPRHTVLVMAALAFCAVTAALLRHRTDTQAPPPVRPDQPPPADLGMIPLTIPEITRLLTTPRASPGHAEHWANWRRRHQARSHWYHQRSRLARDLEIALVRVERMDAAVLGGVIRPTGTSSPVPSLLQRIHA